MNRLRVASTLLRRGMATPGLPHRAAAQVAAIKKWGFDLHGELRQAAARDPRRVAVVDEEQGEITYAELVHRTEQSAMALRARGCDDTSRIGLLALNTVGALEVMLATSLLGADLVLLNTGLAGPQLALCAEQQGVSVIVHDREFAGAVEGVDAATALVPMDELAATARSLTPADIHPPPRQGRTIILTAGTTGPHKGTPRRKVKGLGPLISIIDRIPLRVHDRVLLSAPLFHTWGYASVQLCIGMRCTLVLQRRFDARAARVALADQRCTAMFAVPVMLQRMLQLGPDPAGRPQRLRVVATSGSPYPSGFAHAFMDQFGDVLYNLYGSTEASWICIATPAMLRRDADTVGTPPLDTRVEILQEDKTPASPGDVGRIYVGNALVFEGYVGGESKDFHDGMVDTGDVGHVHDGLYFVDGRSDDMIVSGGENVYPTAVERVIGTHPSVSEVAVVGIPDREYGQRLAAFVVATDGNLDADSVREHVKGELARHAVPREVHFVDELPRNVSGKVLARELRERSG